MRVKRHQPRRRNGTGLISGPLPDLDPEPLERLNHRVRVPKLPYDVLVVRVAQTTTAPAEEFVAALTDFRPGRSKVFGNSADDAPRVAGLTHQVSDRALLESGPTRSAAPAMANAATSGSTTAMATATMPGTDA